MIEPTVGRKVWYWPTENEVNAGHLAGTSHQFKGAQAIDAHIAFVHSNTMINIYGADHNGTYFRLTSVRLLQDDEARPEDGGFCEWMPYQKGQARKTEELLKMESAPASIQDTKLSGGTMPLHRVYKDSAVGGHQYVGQDTNGCGEKGEQPTTLLITDAIEDAVNTLRAAGWTGKEFDEAMTEQHLREYPDDGEFKENL